MAYFYNLSVIPLSTNINKPFDPKLKKELFTFSEVLQMLLILSGNLQSLCNSACWVILNTLQINLLRIKNMICSRAYDIPFQSNPIQSNPIQSNPFNSIPFYSNLFQSIPIHSNPFYSFHSIPIQAIPFQFILFQSSPFQSRPIHSNQSNPPQSIQIHLNSIFEYSIFEFNPFSSIPIQFNPFHSIPIQSNPLHFIPFHVLHNEVKSEMTFLNISI